MVLNVHRNLKAYWGRGYGGGERRRLFTCRYTVTTRMTLALRWAAMRAILMFHNGEGESLATLSKGGTAGTCMHPLFAVYGTVNMVLNVHRNHKAYWGRGGGDGRE